MRIIRTQKVARIDSLMIDESKICALLEPGVLNRDMVYQDDAGVKKAQHRVSRFYRQCAKKTFVKETYASPARLVAEPILTPVVLVLVGAEVTDGSRFVFCTNDLKKQR